MLISFGNEHLANRFKNLYQGQLFNFCLLILRFVLKISPLEISGGTLLWDNCRLIVLARKVQNNRIYSEDILPAQEQCISTQFKLTFRDGMIIYVTMQMFLKDNLEL